MQKVLFLLYLLSYANLPVFLVNITTNTPHYCMWGERVDDASSCPKMLNFTSEHIAKRMEYAETEKAKRRCYKKKEGHHEQTNTSKFTKSIFGNAQTEEYTPHLSKCEKELGGWRSAVPYLFHAQIINYKNGGFCGGNAISPHFLITPAHCVYGETNFSNIHVLHGDREREQGVYVDVTRIVMHEGFLRDDKGNGSNFAYDIALLYTPHVIPCLWTIPLADRSEQIGTQGKVYGFGEANDNTDGSQFLNIIQHAYLDILESSFPEMPTVFTSSGQLGKGDSGAPFLWEERGREVLGGMHTRNAITADDEIIPQYLRIVDFKDWIHKTMEKVLSEENSNNLRDEN